MPPLPSAPRLAPRLALTLALALAAAKPAAAQNAPRLLAAPSLEAGPSLSVASGPGQVTQAVPLTRYTVTGLPAGAATAADPSLTKGTPGVQFTTPNAASPAIATLQSAATSHSPISRIVLDRIPVGTHTLRVILANCSVVRWGESGSERAATLQCTQVVYPTATSQPTGSSTYDVKTAHPGL